jgi:O-antigen/teichoic acid export membrane protein
MTGILQKLSAQYRRLSADSLFRNSGYLLGVNLAGALLSYLFWVAAARFFPQEEIGAASAVISMASFLGILAGLGVGPGLIRYLSTEKDAALLIKTSMLNNLGMSLAVGLVYIALFRLSLARTAPAFTQTGAYQAGILILICLLSLGSLVQYVFQGFRESRFAFWHIIIWDVSGLALLFLLHYLDYRQVGVIPLQAISLLLALLVSLFWFLPRLIPGSTWRFAYSLAAYKKIIPYSLGSFIADLLYRAPMLVTPTIVLAFLDASASAYVYFSWMIGWMITSPGQSLAAAVFSEGSNAPDELPALILRSLWKALLVTVLISLAAYLVSPLLLAIFGKSYSLNATLLLKWLTVSPVLVVLNAFYFSALRVRKRITELLLVNLLSAAVYLAATLLLLERHGIVATGIAWLISQAGLAAFAARYLFLSTQKR